MDTNMTELKISEMEQIAGGKGGSPTVLPRKEGYIVYQSASGETLGRIARKYNTTVNAIVAANTTIKNPDDITAGYWIYIPR